MTSKLDAALALAERGFKVFPVRPHGEPYVDQRGNNKIATGKAPPRFFDWPQRATSNANALQPWPQNANIGIHCEGMLVLDVDVAKKGNDTLLYLQAVHNLPDTLTTITPSGGKHLFFRLPKSHPGVPNSVEKIGKGVDVRSTGGYVVAPGSETPAGRYRFVADAEIADAPPWLIEKAGMIVPKTGTNEPVPDAPDTAVQRAADWLATAEPAIEGQGGDAHTFAVAARLRDFGVSAVQAGELLSVWNERCSPPWSPDELAAKVANAFRYAQNEPGSKVALPEDFPVVALLDIPQECRATTLRLSQFANIERRGPGYLIKGLLQRRSYAELFGQPGEGKTFVALDMSYHVAAALEWMGRKVHGGTVLYLAYEGVGGMVKRAQALRQKYGDKDVPLYVAGAAFNLREQTGRAQLAQILAELPEKPVLIVVDTFARALMGGDENSAQDVGAFNSAIAALIESTGACVMIIHHSGKNKAAGARGSSALLGAIDTELEVDQGAVVASKQRDVELSEPIGFRLQTVAVGLDEDGDAMTSCVVEASSDVSRGKPTGRLAGNPKRGFDVLCALRPNNDPVTEKEWQDACRDFLGTKSVSQRFYDLKMNLLRKQYIQQDNAGMITRRCE